MTTTRSIEGSDELADFRPGSLVDMLQDTVARYGDRIWLTYGPLHWTFAESAAVIDTLATEFSALGVSRGDRVALLMPNHPGFVWSYYAALRLGATVVALNPLYAQDRLDGQLRETLPRLIVGVRIDGEAERTAALASGNGIAAHLWPWDGPELEKRAAALATGRDDAPAAEIMPDETLAVLQGTGGTTGLPKFAMLTHANLRWNVEQTAAVFPKLENGAECLLVPVPFCHITGMTMAMNLAVRLAAETILLPRFNPEAIFELLRDRPVSMLAGVPTIFTALLRDPRSAGVDWSRIKYAAAGGAPAAAETIQRFHTLSGVYIRQCYGLSETSPLVTLMPGQADEPLGAAGLPIPGTRVTIDGADECGEILVAGPQVMQGYWQRPEESEHALQAGMLRTGDIGRIDEAGFLHIVDRQKEVIIASGYNVYPRLVEDAIVTHPAVIEAAVIGIPDAYRGETVRAYAVLRQDTTLTLAELQAHLVTRLSPFEIPKQFEIRQDLPRTPVGKPSRAALREEWAAARSSD
ncbi:AMP-binding protein [Rhizorhabdus dicambivorans]|uniref:Dicarboxylate--CoA ligase PimA n=1 Tax=Rhizorhabdus dicambivorans TaxID=1850238 RepID=A0A2A4FSJ7_9SPHN|nr:AMP-binding protein [Rhizorhabdus dicambivorans]ATE63831.1 dicarboxylate--CoA ligase PimA [Rhizorhabdus dicambivorans]PCE40666.1 dicarboxylate--CoA ligase PimA [Rhizorhabdus dicambivorans]